MTSGIGMIGHRSYFLLKPGICYSLHIFLPVFNYV